MSEPRDRMTVHISIDEAATRDEAEAFFNDLACWVGEWMEAHPERGAWDPFVSAHTDSCDDSDHCHGPGSWVERHIAARALREAANAIERELICCDAYETFRGAGGRHPRGHAICYWSGACRALLLDRAAELDHEEGDHE